MDDNFLLRLLEQEITALFRTRAAKEKKGGGGQMLECRGD